MTKAKRRRSKPSKAAIRARAAIIRRSRQDANLIGIDHGTVVDVTSQYCRIEFKKSESSDEPLFSREFPTWRLRIAKADFVGARVKHEMFWLGHDMPDMVASRLTRIGPTLRLKSAGPRIRLTQQDLALLDGLDDKPPG